MGDNDHLRRHEVASYYLHLLATLIHKILIYRVEHCSAALVVDCEILYIIQYLDYSPNNVFCDLFCLLLLLNENGLRGK